MELEKNNIHMSKILKNEISTFYVTHESSLTEADDMIENIINHHENVSVDNTSIRNNQLIVNGTISFGMMYYTGDSDMAKGVEGETPFEETIKLNSLDENCNVDVSLIVLSSSVKLIDGKNYIYKVQIMANITIEKLEDLEAVSDIHRENVMTKHSSLESLCVIADKTDTFRISERLSVPSGKPAIQKIIWQDVKIKTINTKMLDGMIHIGGELKVFLIYIPEAEGMPQQWVDTIINFGGTLDVAEAGEDLVSYINTTLHNVDIEAEMNQDNETRDISISALLKLNIKIYEEREMEVLEDVYAPDANLVPVIEERKYQKLLVKNESRTKNIVKLDIDQSKGHILQICSSDAEVKIDNIVVSDSGLKAVGKIKACIIYISSDDAHPLCYQCKETDFEHRIDADGIMPEDKYYINWRVEQVSANMISTEQVEIKSVVALETIVFRSEKKDFISEIEEQPIDMEKINAAPMLKGYVVQKGDSLWKLAKENYTTMDNIMKVNELVSEQIKPGDRLLIIKSCQ